MVPTVPPTVVDRDIGNLQFVRTSTDTFSDVVAAVAKMSPEDRARLRKVLDALE
jgi:hypothetical protein